MRVEAPTYPRTASILLTAVVTAATVLTAAVPSSVAADPASIYLVQLADVPAAAYAGTVAGYRSTKPALGARFNARSAAVGRYRTYLTGRHDAVAKVVGARKIYDYSVGFNGFSARMSAADAQRLAGTTGVVSVSRDEIRHTESISTPTFLGLDAGDGLWSRLGGAARAGDGKDIVIGVVDTGVWPENPAFDPLTNPTPLANFRGTCAAGEKWKTTDCDNKIVGARYYNAGIGGDDAIHRAPYVGEVASPRDIAGHGSHTASTAAGNHGTEMKVDGRSYGTGGGMAPAARIAVYKALWRTADGGDGTSDLTKAIDDAVADGVDILNYSVSGSRNSNVDPVSVAFRHAAAAGVFVAAAGGNEGPGASTVAHTSPWVTSVAAGTHDRTYQAKVTLGNGSAYEGVGLGAAVPNGTVVLAEKAALEGVDAAAAKTCLSRGSDPARPKGVLDPAKMTGMIVVCDRGGANARTDKSKAVKEAGGVGMILVNPSPNSRHADAHAVPTVHVSDTAGAAIKTYASGTHHPTAELSAGRRIDGVKAPEVASLSSRGPAMAANGDQLKPDLMAPGVDVLAATSPTTHGGSDFGFESGTSMAAPHVAGIAALLRQLHPQWTPMMVKSALLTSAAVTDNRKGPITTDTGGSAGPFDFGSGEVAPTMAADPGLVYESTLPDWDRFLCGTGELAADSQVCEEGGRIDPSDFNGPNIAIGALAGKQVITRRVTNVGATTSTYKVTEEGPTGLSTEVTPAEMTISAGQTMEYRVTFTRTTAAIGVFATGHLIWTDGTHQVRSQLAVRPVDG